MAIAGSPCGFCDGDGDHYPRGVTRAKALIAAGTGFVLFLAVWATTAGQVKLFTNEGSSVERPGPTALTPGPLVPTSANTREARDPLGPGASTFVTVLTTLVCLIFAAGLLYYLWGAQQERKARERRDASMSDFDVLADDDLDIGREVPSQLTEATEAQLTELLRGNP